MALLNIHQGNQAKAKKEVNFQDDSLFVLSSWNYECTCNTFPNNSLSQRVSSFNIYQNVLRVNEDYDLSFIDSKKEA